VTTFRNWIKDDPAAEYSAEANRYHLYVALACPWVNINLFFAKVSVFICLRLIVHSLYLN
jgi:glutathionyl-hydroquinone reductase